MMKKKVTYLDKGTKWYILYVVIVQSLSHVQLFMTPWTVACQASLSFTISQSLFKLTSIKSVMPTNRLSLILLSSCPQFFPVSGSFPMSWLFASGGQKCWNFSFSINPSNEHSGLIFFRTDWLDLLAVKGTFQESPPAPQFESINSSCVSQQLYLQIV